MTGNFSLQIKLINKCYIINHRLKLFIVEKYMGGGGSKKKLQTKLCWPSYREKNENFKSGKL